MSSLGCFQESLDVLTISAPRTTLVYKYLTPHHPAPKGLVAQLVEHHSGVVMVVGSVPT